MHGASYGPWFTRLVDGCEGASNSADLREILSSLPGFATRRFSLRPVVDADHGFGDPEEIRDRQELPGRLFSPCRAGWQPTSWRR